MLIRLWFFFFGGITYSLLLKKDIDKDTLGIRFTIKQKKIIDIYIFPTIKASSAS